MENRYEFEEDITPVLTSVPLPKEKNESNDCGPMAVEMILGADFPANDNNLSYLRGQLNKEGSEGTLPGNICKFLKETGYDVEYFTTINWAEYTKDFGPNFEYLPEKAQPFIDFFKDGFINSKKLQESAQWLSVNASICKNELITYDRLSKFLHEGKRIILIVGGDHYLTVTGVDEKNVYFNNPDSFITGPDGERKYLSSRKQSLSYAEMEEWATRNINSIECIVADPKKEKDRISARVQSISGAVSTEVMKATRLAA